MQRPIVYMIIIEEDKILAEVGLKFSKHSILVNRFSWEQVRFYRVKFLDKALFLRFFNALLNIYQILAIWLFNALNKFMIGSICALYNHLLWILIKHYLARINRARLIGSRLHTIGTSNKCRSSRNMTCLFWRSLMVVFNWFLTLSYRFCIKSKSSESY